MTRVKVRVGVLPSTWYSGCVRVGGERRVSGYELIFHVFLVFGIS